MEHQGHQEHQGHKAIGADIDRLARVVVDAGYKIHRTQGPGLLESAYEHCLARELELRGLNARRQVSLPVVYEGMILDSGYRLDLVVEDSLIVEIKAIEALSRLHQAQILTYLRLSGYRIGLLMNFNVEKFRDGVRRFVL